MAKLVMTVEEMRDRQAWLKLRNSGLGGSDASVIMGMNPWKSRLALWAEKTGEIEPDDLSGNQRVYWGQKNEQNIAEWFMEQTGKRVIRRGMMQSCDHPWMLASVDREVVGEKAGLEIKTAGVDQAKYWRDDNIPDAWIERLEAHYGPIDWSQYAAPEKPAADGKSDTTPELVEVLRQELAAKNALIDKLTDLLAKKIGE